MGHLTSRDAYRNLEDRINWFTQGAAPSETLTKILRVLFTEKEAKWVAKLPIRPFTLKKAARLWGTTEAKAEKLLDHLCEKGLLVDSYDRGIRKFVLPPPMIGFFEFSLMRTRGDIDQKYLSELFYQYINVEEDFIKDLFLGMDTKLGRVFVNEPVLMTEKTNHILDYERATHIIEDADFIGVGTCFCRHKNYHLGIPCKLNAPMETCLTFGNVARSLAEHGGYTRRIDKSEALEILEMSYGYNLVQMGENVRERPAFMCNCCGCCCEALEAVRRFAPMQPIATTNYLPKINPDECVSCGKCEKVCPILAIVAFCFFISEQRIRFRDTLFALVPVLIYAVLYYVMVVVLGEDRGGWNDFYGFATRLPVWIPMVSIMPLTFLIATVIRIFHNRTFDKRRQEEAAYFSEIFAHADIREIVAAMARFHRESGKGRDIVVPGRVIAIMVENNEGDCTWEECCGIYLKEYLQSNEAMDIKKLWF